MKTLILALLVSIFSFTSVLATDPNLTIQQPGAATAEKLPGVELAEGIAQITGTAISPLLGVSSVGAWRYYHTPESLREDLPWFCHPRFWASAFAVLGLCFLKDFLGTVAPPLIKKPLDMAELFESKISALVASAAFIPVVAAQMAQHFGTPTQVNVVSMTELHQASVLPLAFLAFDYRLIIVPLCIFAFFVVWMTCHAINVLIAICPFGFIDTLLKLVKMTILSSVVLSYIINPYLGASVSLLIVFVAAMLAPSAFRLTVFGTIFGVDTLLPWRARRTATPADAHAFVARATVGVPRRTYGKISRAQDGNIQFSFRPWLILSRRTIQLPTSNLAISKGVYHPSLLHRAESSDQMVKIVVFPPRYRKQERAIADHFAITDMRDSSLTKGFKAARAWIAETMNIGKNKYAQFQRSRAS